MAGRWSVALCALILTASVASALDWQDRQALMDSLRHLPPNIRSYYLDKAGFDMWPKAQSRPESSGLRLCGKWGGGPSVRVTGRDSIVYLSRGSEVVVINYADMANPHVLTSIQAPGLIARSILVGNRLYISSGYIETFDISDPANPVRLGSLFARAPAIDIVDTLVYTLYRDSFKVFNFADPANPVLLGACRDSGYDLSVCNGSAFIGGRSGLYVLDVTNPASPHRIASWGSNTISVKARGNICCATLADANDNLTFYVLDARQPASIVPLGSLADQGGYDMYLSDSLAFLSGYYTGSGYEFKILSIGDSVHPRLIGQASTPGDNNGVWANAGRRLAFIADQIEGLQVFDVFDLGSPRLDTTMLKAGQALDIFVTGHIACVAEDVSGLRILDLSDPSRPSELSALDTVGQMDLTGCVVARDSFAYMPWTPNPARLRTVDISDPQHPTVVATVAGSSGDPKALALRDTFLYSAGRYRFQVINVARPREPVLVGSCVLGGYSGDLALVDTIAYLSGPVLSVVNVAKPDSPRVVSTWSRGVSGLDVVDTILYAVGQNAQFWAVSVADPTSPRCLDSLRLPSYDGEDVVVLGSTAFISENVMRMVDVSDPGNLRLTGQTALPYWTPRLVHNEPYLYACCAEGGVCILETVPTGIAESKPARPEGWQLVVSPSVTSGRLMMDVPTVAGNGELTVYNVAGKEVLRLQAPAQRNDLTERWPVDLSRLSAGVYVLRLDGSGVSQTGKIVLTRR